MTQKDIYTLYLIRHGYSEGNRDKRLAGHTDVPLTEEGREELRRFRSQRSYPRADIYCTSGLARANETLSLLYPDVEGVRQRDQFKEIYFGQRDGWLPGSREEVVTYFTNWFQGIDQGFGEEPFDSFQRRSIEATRLMLEELREEHLRSAVVVCHSGVMRAIYAWFHNVPKEQFFDVEAPNGGGYKLEFVPDETADSGWRFVNSEILFEEDLPGESASVTDAFHESADKGEQTPETPK